MKLKAGLSALVTGGAGAIGREIVLALSRKGIFITIADVASEEKGGEVASLAGNHVSMFHNNLQFPPVLFFKCDVANSNNLTAAFEKHVETYGGLDICVTCAGIMNPFPFHKDQSDGSKSWRHTVNIDFLAVIDSTRLAIRAMKEAKRPGVIIHIASATGLYPMYSDPIYSGSKGGVVLFTRSLAPYRRQGIRVNVLCPEFVQTELTDTINPAIIDVFGGFLPVEMVVKGVFELLLDESKAGSCLWISKRRGFEYTPTPVEEEKYHPNNSIRRNPVQIPQSFEKIVVNTLSHNIRSTMRVVQAPLRLPLKPDQVLLKIIYAGVNATDAVGIIADVGYSVEHLKIGTPAAIRTYGSYAEFAMVPSKDILPVARPDPEVIAMLTSGLTASISLQKTGKMDSGKLVLVTDAAGGTGQFAVQLAKLAGNKVIAACGCRDKFELLKNLGVDRVIDYKTQNIKTVLKNEFPRGVDIIYESVGGEMFDWCLNALSTYGRIIVIGMNQGQQERKQQHYTGLCEKILAKSLTVDGFLLSQYAHLWQQHLDKLVNLYSSGELKIALDPKPFLGIHSIADAVEYLHSGKSVGKVVVCIDPTFKQPQAKL